jgi:hypothetical protein
VSPGRVSQRRRRRQQRRQRRPLVPLLVLRSASRWSRPRRPRARRRARVGYLASVSSYRAGPDRTREVEKDPNVTSRHVHEAGSMFVVRAVTDAASTESENREFENGDRKLAPIGEPFLVSIGTGETGLGRGTSPTRARVLPSIGSSRRDCTRKQQGERRVDTWDTSTPLDGRLAYV